MLEPKTSTLYEMPLMDHEEGSLDALATRVYGSEYQGQQTDYLPNDSYHVYNMDENVVEELNSTMEEKRHYLGYDPLQRKGNYHEGHNWFEYWLSLKHDPDGPDNYNNPEDGKDHFGESFKYDSQVYRQAPTINYVLADLIKRGELPYGRYLLHCWW